MHNFIVYNTMNDYKRLNIWSKLTLFNVMMDFGDLG